jgi:hypothetical protein
MRKLSLGDVYPPRLYEAVRDDLRQRVIEVKRARRIHLGPVVTLVFENRTTMIFQVCEMLRAESIEQPDRIRDEIEVYNALLPDEGELSATLFVEITDSERIRPTLREMVGIDEHLTLEVAGRPVRAVFEAGRSEEDRISSVQYVRFPLDPEARRALATPGTRLALASDLPGYPHRDELSEATRASLADDLRP